MNMGVWILSGAAPTAITTGLLINRKGVPGAIGEVSGWLSGFFGAALAGYTGVLISNTAIPIWRESRRWLPVLFEASGASAAVSILEIVSGDRSSRAVTRTFGTVARLAEIGAARQVERAVCSVPQVAKPLRKGGASILWKAATALTAASLCLSLTAGRSRRRTAAAGWLGVAGSLCLRLAVHYLGNASARDPQASFAQQRVRRS
jgi:formate-dependent nitrite reductase membrane component NrfD